jgi:hypothetical protein
MWIQQLHDLIFLLPPMNMRVGPAEVLTAIGLIGSVYVEVRLWRLYH